MDNDIKQRVEELESKIEDITQRLELFAKTSGQRYVNSQALLAKTIEERQKVEEKFKFHQKVGKIFLFIFSIVLAILIIMIIIEISGY